MSLALYWETYECVWNQTTMIRLTNNGTNKMGYCAFKGSVRPRVGSWPRATDLVDFHFHPVLTFEPRLRTVLCLHNDTHEFCMHHIQGEGSLSGPFLLRTGHQPESDQSCTSRIYNKVFHL